MTLPTNCTIRRHEASRSLRKNWRSCKAGMRFKITPKVRFDDEYMRVELTDGRILSLPLWWIPTLYNATPEEREKCVINRDRTMIIWDPDKCAINDEVRIADYLGPCGEGTQ